MFSAPSPLLARSLILKRLGGGYLPSVKGTARRPASVAGAALAGSTATAVATPNCALPPSSSSSLTWRRWYITRAHPQPTPVVAVPQALEETLDGARRRGRRRQRKWNRNEERKASASTATATATATTPAATATTTSTSTCSHPDETIELALNLNLDPRKPGQSLRGSISLPHGTGKKLSCLVFTKDASARKKALSMGASYAGGESLVKAILGAGTDDDNALGNSSSDTTGEQNDDDDSNSDVTISIDSLDRVLATQDMLPVLSKTLARLLGPRGLMPNAKTGTVFSTSESLLESLETQIAGKEVVYRTERAGVVHVPIGKTSFGVDKLLENIGSVMVELYKVKPEQYGKASTKKKSSSSNLSASAQAKASKHAKYLLSAYISATQGKSYKLDVRTIDPNSSFFLRAVEAPGAAARAVEKEKEEQQQQLAAAASAAESAILGNAPSSTTADAAGAEQINL
jgi:large subunit ribosomal protein L1